LSEQKRTASLLVIENITSSADNGPLIVY